MQNLATIEQTGAADLVENVLGHAAAAKIRALAAPMVPTGGHAPVNGVDALRFAEALNLVLFADLLQRVPEGADAVIMAEVCEEQDGRVAVRDAVAPRKNVGVPGEDIQSGSRVLAAGRQLRPQDAGLLASIGRASVSCVRPPRVRLVVTGDELLPAGVSPQDDGARIVDSNSVVLRALVERDGGEALPFAILPDRAENGRPG